MLMLVISEEYDLSTPAPRSNLTLGREEKRRLDPLRG
jgi:hypothetical protein